MRSVKKECRGVILSGQSFCGKTTIAAEIMYEACRIYMEQNPKRIHHTEIKLMQNGQFQKEVSEMVRSKVVFWDDVLLDTILLMGNKYTPWRMYMELNKETPWQSFTIFTTNIDIEKLIEKLILDGDAESDSPRHLVNRLGEYVLINM